MDDFLSCWTGAEDAAAGSGDEPVPQFELT